MGGDTTNTNYGSSVLVQGTGSWNTNDYIQFVVEQKNNPKGISPQLYFTYVKKKFGSIETMRLNQRLKKLEAAFNKAVEGGQEALGKKLLTELVRETRESAMYAKGIKHFIERDDLHKYKHKIRDGHISDTKLKDFTRKIPDDVLKRKKEVEFLFDDFYVYHYWNQKEADKVEKKQKMDPEEKARMKDPILFGVIKESNRLYFIADWEDEHCDLSFDELVDAIAKDDEAFEINRNPKLNV